MPHIKYTQNFGSHKLYYKCILIGRDGQVDYFALNDDDLKSPKVSFLNASKRKVLRMEVSKDWNVEVQGYAEKFKPNDISNFASIKKGNYSLFWQFPYQVEDDTYLFYPKSNGKDKEIFSFKNGEYYLFLISSKDDNEYAVLYDITPY